jgi:hypothetical protein
LSNKQEKRAAIEYSHLYVGEFKMDNNFEDDEDAVLPPSHPSRQQRKHRGWQGEDMEMEHQREASSSIASGMLDKDAATAVDLNQFRNTEVGKGYQAKHVMRQKTSSNHSSDDRESAKKKAEIQDATRRRTREANEEEQTRKKPRRDANRCEMLNKDTLLHNVGLRDFRKEIESILSFP